MKTTNLKFLHTFEYGRYALEILNFFVPLALKLPKLREDPSLMTITVKAEGNSGIQDIATGVDTFMQRKIKKEAAKLHSDWQFWGEEGEDNVTEYDPGKNFLLITDPIEGTINFRARKDDLWGSVIALVEIKTGKPVIGIVAHPPKSTFYLGVKGCGAYVLLYKDNRIISISKMLNKPEQGFEQFTYNNSPQFNEKCRKAAKAFISLGIVQKNPEDASVLDKSRKKIVMKDSKGNNQKFLDLESGVLEVIRNKGTIYFHTSNEMAAAFVILEEIGGIISDADGKPWHLGINSLISARNQEDYDYLKSLADKARGVR